MNSRIFECINAYADRMNRVQRNCTWAHIDKVDVYHAVDEMMELNMTRLCLQMYDRCRTDRSQAVNAVSMFLSSIQYLLPHNYQQTADGRVLESFSDQVSRLTGTCQDKEMNFVLKFIERARNGLVHYGMIQQNGAPAGLFGTDDTENWWNLLNCILYTAVFYWKLTFVRPRWTGFSIFRYNWRKIFSGNYTKVKALGATDGFFGLIPMLLGRIVQAAGIIVVTAVTLTVVAGCAAIVREIKNAIFNDDVVFVDMSREEVASFVSGLSKAERARYMADRMEILNESGNNYKVGDTVRCHEDLITQALYEMAVKERLPNASKHLGGFLTEMTYNLSHVPVLRLITQIPSRHRYMVHDPERHKQSNVPDNDDLLRSYYSTRMGITADDASYGNVNARLSSIRTFARAMSEKGQVEYLIIGRKGNANITKVRNALSAAGVSSSRIKTAYTGSNRDNVGIRVRIIKYYD